MREELRVSQEFLERYNRPGPRYTSYPTAPVWNGSFGASDLEKVHQEAESLKALNENDQKKLKKLTTIVILLNNYR